MPVNPDTLYKNMRGEKRDNPHDDIVSFNASVSASNETIKNPPGKMASEQHQDLKNELSKYILDYSDKTNYTFSDPSGFGGVELLGPRDTQEDRILFGVLSLFNEDEAEFILQSTIAMLQAFITLHQLGEQGSTLCADLSPIN